jgi:1-acyl-sn-glycerol-3-phosphate acyltransferase
MAKRTLDPGSLAHPGRPLGQRLARRVLVVVLRCLVRLEVEGLENIPASGPFILAANHLHVLDPAIGLLLVPRRVFGIVKDRWRRPPFGWLLAAMGDVLYVGGSSPHAMRDAARVLRDGDVVAILPEGTRSRTGALGPGRPGVASLARRGGVPIVPAAACGQERAARWWRRLRRVPVQVRIGPPIELPSGRAARDRLQADTDEVMRAIARLLPPDYRGVYRDISRPSR